ncbi:unnamed protein product [Caenorhabditis sp. 36 PRJEB53466]|nr:unnamed protein product [Caenorhabditis sp. 36 PRJEB53466]
MEDEVEEVNYNNFDDDFYHKSEAAGNFENFVDSDSDEDISFVADEVLMPKEIAKRKIEFALNDINEQMSSGLKRVVLRTSYDNSHFQLKYSSNLKLKLERDLNCLHQVYDLLENDKKSTKREMYYEFKALYGVQKNMDTSIKAVCELLDEKRSNLNILSCGRGLLRGAITFITDKFGIIDGREQTVLVTDSFLSSDLICEAKFVLIVEKDTTFQKLLDENFQSIFPDGILVTARGYPDISTRNVVKFIAEKRRIPVFGLFDADPHGLEIYLTYKYGAMKEKAEGRGAFVPTLQWIGLYPSDFHKFPIDPSQILSLSNQDHTKIHRLIPRSIQLGEQEVTRELDWMLQNRFKLELESVNLCGSEFMSRFLIRPRLLGLEPEIPRIEHKIGESDEEENSDIEDAELISELIEEMIANDSSQEF